MLRDETIFKPVGAGAFLSAVVVVRLCANSPTLFNSSQVSELDEEKRNLRIKLVLL